MMSVISQFSVLVIFLLSGIVTSSFFNADELTSALYDVDISGEPKLFSERVESATSMMLLSKHGQRYECILPTNVHTVGNLFASAELPDAKRKSLEEEEEERKKMLASLAGIPRLLDGLSGSDCLRLSKGWWEYEFCFRNRIRQYHRNEQTGAMESEIVLGEYSKDYDWTATAEKPNEESSPASSGSKLTPPRSHSQTYDKGTVCDLTGEPRQAQVVFHCDLSPHATDTLVDVEEPVSCVYRLTVKTQRLCSNPTLRRAAEEQIPSRRRPSEMIHCRPLLPPESMQRYKEVQAAKAAAAKRKSETEKLKRIFRENPQRREARIRLVLGDRLRGPARRRKLLDMSLRRHQRLRRRLAVAEQASAVADSVLTSARRISSGTESSLKAITKRLTAKFKAIHAIKKAVSAAKKEEKEEKKETKEAKEEKDGKEEERKEKEDADADAIRKAMAALPQEVRRRLTSADGLDGLRAGLGAQFQQVLDAARREAGQAGGETDPRLLLRRMSDMVDRILEQVDAAGRRLDEESKRLDAEMPQEKAAPRTDEPKAPPPGEKKDPAAKDDDAPLTFRKPRGRDKKAAAVDVGEAPTAQGKVAPSADGAQAAGKSLTSRDVEQLRGRLESELRDRIERRGLEASSMMLHVLTLDGDTDGKKEKPSFVGIIILKNDQQQREQERMRRLEENYNFRIDEPPPS